MTSNQPVYDYEKEMDNDDLANLCFPNYLSYIECNNRDCNKLEDEKFKMDFCIASYYNMKALLARPM